MNIVYKVSVIIPIYNVEPYLRQCLDSVCNQTFKDIEIICINDCSTDNSLKILEEYQKKDNRIVLVDLTENKGVGIARDIGIKSAKSKYVTFIDPDDWIKTNYVEVLYNTIKRNDTDFVGADFYLYKDGTIVDKATNINLVFDKILTKENIRRKYLQQLNNLSICLVWAKIYKKDFLISNNISFEIRKLEDNFFMWQVLIKAKSFMLIKDKLLYHRFARPGSSEISYTVDNRLYLFKKLYSLSQQDYYRNYLKDFYTYISISISYYIENTNIAEAKYSFYEFKKLFYNENFKLTYKYINIRNKIRLFVFNFCLKHNLNYVNIGKFHHKYNPIRLFTGK
ncbi:MAG: glycosyltransferase family 2 protein [Elusimicrobia bacterium]|nr:glycosyltransferase family 2 protein [Elusimicrobiota bacterium]